MLQTDALLLDLDGTLVDSSESIERCWRRWAREHGVDVARLLAIHHGRTTVETVALFLPPEVAAEAAARMQELELADVNAVRPLPGAVELASSLPAGRWAIVTSGDRRLASARVRAAGLPTPRVVVTSEDVDQGKPHPAPYLLAAERLELDPARCVAVEDAPSGVASARAAGMTVVGVTTSHDGDALDADVVVDGPSALRVSGAGPLVVALADA